MRQTYYFLTAVFAFFTMSVHSQEIQVTFSGLGETTVIDSIIATNFTSNESITLPGDGTLTLTASSGISLLPNNEVHFNIYPNPADGVTNITYASDVRQTIIVQIVSAGGIIVYKNEIEAEMGLNYYNLQFASEGVFVILLKSNTEQKAFKVISKGANSREFRITPLGVNEDVEFSTLQKKEKSFLTEHSLGYVHGDVIHYRCMGGGYTAVLLDSLFSSKNYDVNFVACTDPAGRNYSTIRIGEQIWMEENLAYLPIVNRSSYYSTDDPAYYVYSYSGTDTTEAKTQAKYKRYGVLYNWEAAMGACPTGWHLPTDEEWSILENHLFLNFYGYGGRGDKLAKALSSRSSWNQSSVYGSPGYNQVYNNRSGLNMLPSGFLFPGTFGQRFRHLGTSTTYWTSTEVGDSEAWVRGLQNNIATIERWSNYAYKNNGNPVRCVKDE